MKLIVFSDVSKSLTFSGYKLQGRTKVHGMQISIENKRGSCRKGVDKDGHKWKTKMYFDYGYIRGTVGKDKDHLDCYVGPNKKSEKVFIVHQNDPTTGNYDEDKVMLGFNSASEAKEAYLKQYDRPGFFGSMDETTIEKFKETVFKDSNKGKKVIIKKGSELKLVVLMKGRKPLPVGTEKVWQGKVYKKTVDGWIPKASGKGRGRPKKEDNENKLTQKEQADKSGVDLKDTDSTLKRGNMKLGKTSISFETPYVGKTGAKLVGYSWPHHIIEDEDARGETIYRRVSEWDQAEINKMTGRKHVHKFIIITTEGQQESVSAESAAVALGLSEAGLRQKATKLLEDEIQRQKKVEKAKEYAKTFIENTEWKPTAGEAIGSGRFGAGSVIDKMKYWYEQDKKMNSNFAGRETLDVYKGPKGWYYGVAGGYDADRKTFNEILKENGIEELTLKASEIWDEQGNPRK